MTARALLEAIADEMKATTEGQRTHAGPVKLTVGYIADWEQKIRTIASSLEGHADVVENGEGLFHLDDLAAVCQQEGFSDRDYERLSYALEVTRTAKSKDKPA